MRKKLSIITFTIKIQTHPKFATLPNNLSCYIKTPHTNAGILPFLVRQTHISTHLVWNLYCACSSYSYLSSSAWKQRQFFLDKSKTSAAQHGNSDKCFCFKSKQKVFSCTGRFRRQFPKIISTRGSRVNNHVNHFAWILREPHVLFPLVLIFILQQRTQQSLYNNSLWHA